MRFAGLSRTGRTATWLAERFYPPYKSRHALAGMSGRGYVSSSAAIHHPNLAMGRNVFLGDRTVIFGRGADEKVILGDEVYINQDTTIESGDGGTLVIGSRSTVQPRCQFSAYTGAIRIGEDVQIAPNCAFYPYNHRIDPGTTIKNQPLVSKGGIVIDDDVWLGYGVIVLDGVTIGKGAVVGAGSVVNQSIPAGAIAVGVPARVVKMRDEASSHSSDTSIAAD